jgi:type IX secretion system PorP/SprF family membrane protein
MRAFLLSVLLTGCVPLIAQNTFRPNLYYNQLNFYNPAAGWADSSRGNASVYLQHKWEKSDVFEKPVNIFANYLSGSKNFKHRYSVGYLYDGYSFYTRNLIYLGYAYTIDMPGTGVLTVGARTALFFDYINGNKISQSMEDDISGAHFTPDLDLGLYYTLKRMRVSFSAKNIVANKVSLDGFPIITNHREMNFLIGGDVSLIRNISVSPFTMVRYERSFRFDGGLSLKYKEWVELTYIMRVMEARNILMLQTGITNKISLGVSADFSLVSSDINTDIQVRYKF